MKRRIKNNIKNLMKTMRQAHTKAFSLLQNRRVETANELLSQCQDCALYIGEARGWIRRQFLIWNCIVNNYMR